MIALTLAAMLSATSIQAAPVQSPPQDTPVRLEDIEVVGRPLDSLINDFVGSVAAPNPNRGLARWRQGVCVGVTNLRNDAAQYIVDRVSTIASDMGLKAGAPGCSPNLIIAASDDPNWLARDLTQRKQTVMRRGGSGMDRGAAALQAFQSSDRPVRWWQVSMPVDSQSGERATRMPGECRADCGATASLGGTSYLAAPQTNLFAASRLSSQIVDDIFQSIVIIDVNQLSSVKIEQLADYIAMVSLAQIDPNGDTSRYASILNIFSDPDSAEGLTDWDRAYLTGLYKATRTRANLRASRLEIASSIRRAHQDLRADSHDEN